MTAAEREALYAKALHRHLAGLPRKEIDFFVNRRRLAMIERLIGEEVRRPGQSILNVACGPFALEFYLNLSEARVESFDREQRLCGLHLELTNRGLIAPNSFHVADVVSYSARHTFDIVIINDLFYSKAVDFYALIGRYVSYVNPGGLLYFDIQDERAGPVWRAFGKDEAFRRYDLSRVSRVLNEAGLEILAVEPALGIKGGIDGAVRRGLWRTMGIANSFVFVARKSGA